MKSIFWTLYALFARLARWWRRWRLRLQARRPSMISTPKAFVSRPEPRSIGNFARGQQMLIGNFQFAGSVIEAPDRSIWDLTGEALVIDELHGCGWIDDLAATGRPGQRTMQGWIADWIRRHGRGSGPGWRPDLTGRRLIRWISHAITIMQGQDKTANATFLRSIAKQASFLSRTWAQAPEGLPRVQALTGMIYAGLALEGMEHMLRPCIRRLGQECADRIGADGSIDSRAPEELMEIFTLLTWAAIALDEAGQKPDPRHLEALERMAPTLRVLMLGDGTLVRFHGGGRGEQGQLDQALAESGVRSSAARETRMGYSRLAAGRTIAVIDAAAPSEGPRSDAAHASTLAFEMSTGRMPLIVNSGPGRYFGERWRRAARATGCHSTLVVEDMSSATIWDQGFAGDTFGERLYNAPPSVTFERIEDATGTAAIMAHTGYVREFGLTHERRVSLAAQGQEFRGEDRLYCTSAADRRIYDRAQRQPDEVGLRFAIHFHIHPDVAVSLDLGGNAVSMKLKNDELWVFRQSGGLISLEDGVYLDQRHLRPRMTKQIVVHGLTQNAAGAVSWAMTRAQDGRRYSSEAMADEIHESV